ncbi:hypothetical protein [Streptomyces sp. GC420]|uniref:hypothetical protein n=1 Tax=Streptomyces sp. GC420 TaxID=2697568 RepID=UPI001414F39B|nr:hypothetical protein [Streptomyces sp. GC420]NBM16845.1 hypothetical protein [Streptomyces sp. GC420]
MAEHSQNPEGQENSPEPHLEPLRAVELRPEAAQREPEFGIPPEPDRTARGDTHQDTGGGIRGGIRGGVRGDLGRAPDRDIHRAPDRDAAAHSPHQDVRTAPRPGPPGEARRADHPPGFAVLATVALSLALHGLGVDWLSVPLLVLACALWLLLALTTAEHFVRHPWDGAFDTRPALTALAATALLVTRCSLQDWQAVAAVLLLEAVVLWLVLLPHLARGLPETALSGALATQGLALSAATLGGQTDSAWIRWPALALLCFGVLLHGYGLARAFDARRFTEGGGEQWLTVAVLAVAATTAAGLDALSGHVALRVLGEVLLGLAVASYVVLVCCEALWLRLHYDIGRWVTAFALAMTAAAAPATGAETLGRVLLWPAIAVWIAVAMGGVLSAARRPALWRGRMGMSGQHAP